ncbi:hypothetical protein PHLGIDRAFT_212269 [Phlebiopsis gigantea 11061_1 CR5-6]|uniref:Uncharacterized protein n=1 Tax=Phlebiopsis gigantea (strain 11061_1 CR5-6) TaxID=745531 RepID=A0A0C3S2W8_PHLG1|nr:hypothetical protein PHLGIDRAFT_212269 [Phlebiopsis gigantea 11061_1 CR5-6]
MHMYAWQHHVVEKQRFVHLAACPVDSVDRAVAVGACYQTQHGRARQAHMLLARRSEPSMGYFHGQTRSQGVASPLRTGGVRRKGGYHRQEGPKTRASSIQCDLRQFAPLVDSLRGSHVPNHATLHRSCILIPGRPRQLSSPQLCTDGDVPAQSPITPVVGSVSFNDHSNFVLQVRARKETICSGPPQPANSEYPNSQLEASWLIVVKELIQ